MAIVDTKNGDQRRGKLNKKSKEVHRIVNGKEHVYSIENPYQGPPSDAQKLQRSIFGKTTAVVNVIMSDPEQVKIWQERMEQHNQSIAPYLPPYPKRFKTLRKYIHTVISEQISKKPSLRRRKAKLPVTLPRGVRLQVKSFSDLSAAELYEILKARFTVFVAEQHIIYVDEDNIDYSALHFAIRRKGLVIAYARLFEDTEKGIWNVGRMLTIERNKGYGKYLMLQMMEVARSKGADTLRLHAQIHAVPFYEHLGFHTVGDIFTEADIPHILMEIPL
jgi:ElaA protein